MNEPKKTHVVGRLPAMTHLGEIGTLIEQTEGVEFKRVSYTGNGVEWALTDFDGLKYQLVLMPMRT